ncbi:hypothetical protein CYANOKiyG1_03800 [Okeania sp. KiyG1]|nr:hypothetical protein CYANOKiyG1_03800 [Okeania sp. KiyG1]
MFNPNILNPISPTIKANINVPIVIPRFTTKFCVFFIFYTKFSIWTFGETR